MIGVDDPVAEAAESVAERGCGTRQKGAVYVVCPLSDYGRPLEDFLIDPPHVIDLAAFGATPVGIHPLWRDGVMHLLDWVGEDSYPNVADFVEEVRRMGLSRRISRTFPWFDQLTADSTIFLVHRRAHLANAEAYAAELDGGPVWCPKLFPHHNDLLAGMAGAPMCAALWWEDVEGGRPVDPDDRPTLSPRTVVREMPSFRYVARRRSVAVEPSYEPAMFLRLPIRTLAVINDPVGATHEAALAAASAAGIPVTVENA